MTPSSEPTRGPDDLEVLSFRPGIARVVESVVLLVLFLVLISLAIVLYSSDADPIDLRTILVKLAIQLPLTLVIVVPLIAHLRRITVPFTPEGVGRRPDGRPVHRWADVVAIDQVWGPLGRHPRLRMTNGARHSLGQPPGSWWRPRDPRLERDLRVLREFAARHGAPLAEPGPAPPARGRILAAVAVLAALPALVAPRFLGHGVLAPWDPTVATFPTACDALRNTRLDTLWPADDRRLDKTTTFRQDYGDHSFCTWLSKDTDDHPAFRSLDVVVLRHKSSLFTGAVSAAIGEVDGKRSSEPGASEFTDLGDEAVSYDDTDTHTILARRANLTIGVTVRGEDESRAKSIDHDIAADIIGRARLS